MNKLDVVGIALILAFMAWVVLVASQVGGHPWPVLALVTGAVVAMIVGGISATRRPLAIPILVASSPFVLSVLFREPVLGDGPLAYVNASGALFVIAAAAALIVGDSTTHRVVRSVAYGTAATWIAIPWIIGARTAAIAAVLLALALLAPHTETVRRVVLLGGTGLVMAGIGFTLVLGIGYETGGRAGTTDRMVDATLGELRVVVWRDAAELVRDNPVWGVGPGMFQQVSPTARARADAARVHNEYLQLAAETGIVGGLLFAALVACAFVRLNQPVASRRVTLAAVALGGVAINATIDYVWHYPAVVLALALLVGGAADPNQPAPRSQALSSGRARAAILATLGLWVVLLLPIEIMNPAYTIPNGVARLRTTSGIEFTDAGGLIQTLQPPVALYERIVENQALTIEMWAATHDVDQQGPARLVSASEGTINRNLTVGQDGARLIFRLRTTETDWNATDPHLSVEDVFATTDLQHIVVTTNVAVTRVFVDGAMRAEWVGLGGTLENWIHSYPLLLGNERDGDRPWLGELRLVSIYDGTLSIEDVQARYASGSLPSAATASIDPEAIAEYAFDEPGGTAVIDGSQMALGGDLEIPTRYAVPSSDFVAVMFDLEHRPMGRFTMHALVFAAWTIPIVPATWRRYSPSITMLVVSGCGVAIMLGASIARHATGRAPSLIDVAGGLIGCAAVCALLPRLRRSSLPARGDYD